MKILPESDFVITKADEQNALGSKEIKPCPHCGKWAFSVGTKNNETGNTVYKVNCTNTDCMAQSFYCSKDPAEARTKAIERWNLRAVESENKRLREAMSLVISALRNGSAASPDASIGFLCDSAPREVFIYVHYLRQLFNEVIAVNPALEAQLLEDIKKAAAGTDTVLTKEELLAKINPKGGAS